MSTLRLRAGDWVEVRSKDEILHTLDQNGMLEGMPFMPEMFDYCGRRFQVRKSAHKTCDTIGGTGGRHVTDSVHLDGVRCSGQAHDGCDAACTVFWKEAWLATVEGSARATPMQAQHCTEDTVRAAARGPRRDGATIYVCQATELVRFSTPLRWWDVRQYLQDYRTGNATLRAIAFGVAYSCCAHLIAAFRRLPRIQRALVTTYDQWQALRNGVPFPRKTGTIPGGQPTPQCALNLEPGELVRIKTHNEILATLDTRSKNRGLYFDAEHVPFCGSTHRVLARVSRIVDEKSGKMLELKTESVVLDGVTCHAYYSDRRMFCPRAIYPYWRDIWLERVEPDART